MRHCRSQRGGDEGAAVEFVRLVNLTNVKPIGIVSPVALRYIVPISVRFDFITILSTSVACDGAVAAGYVISTSASKLPMAIRVTLT